MTIRIIKHEAVPQTGSFEVQGRGQMKGRIAQPWTPSEDEQLRKFAAEGRSSVTIAERMKRSPASIRESPNWAKVKNRKHPAMHRVREAFS